MYESYRDLFLIVILCHNWYMSLVKRLIFTQCMYGMWIDNLFKTSQKKKLGNVCTRYYVDFIFFSAIERLRNFCRVFLWTNTTLKDTYLCFRVISSSCCIGIARAFPVAVKRYSLKLKIHKFKNQESASQFLEITDYI